MALIACLCNLCIASSEKMFVFEICSALCFFPCLPPLTLVLFACVVSQERPAVVEAVTDFVKDHLTEHTYMDCDKRKVIKEVDG